MRAESKNAERLDAARSCLEAFNLAAADILCRDVLDEDLNSAQAWNLLGKVAMQLGSFEKAAAYFSNAAACGIGEARDEAITATTELRRAASATPRTATRYLMIGAWGAGFWSDVAHVLGGLLLAELTNRVPLVHWGETSRYGGSAERNAFTLYFESLSTTGAEIAWHSSRPPDDTPIIRHTPFFLNRIDDYVTPDCFLSIPELAPWIPDSHPLAGKTPEELFRYAIRKYLKPLRPIMSEAHEFFMRSLSRNRYVAVHIRGSDKAVEYVPQVTSEEFIARLTREVFSVVDQIDPRFDIFLLTEDERVKAIAEKRYPGRIITAPTQRTDGDVAPHFTNSSDKVRLGVEVLRDVLLALRAEAFVGFGGSNVSAMVTLLRDWPPGHSVLIGPALILSRSAYLYLPEAYRHLAIE